jgi:YggT family protein
MAQTGPFDAWNGGGKPVQAGASRKVPPRSMFSAILLPLLMVVDWVIGLYMFVVIVAVIASWLVAFGVLDMRNQLARQLIQVLDSLTEPVFRRIRRFLPPLGGLDLSPIIVFIVLQLARWYLEELSAYLAIHA